ncbi:KATNB1-like protein 1, partial [Pristimantis euphronides]
MKEGNISQEKLASVVNRVSGGQRSVSDQHHYKVVVRKRKALHQALSPASGRKHQKGWGCDMANKKNEIVAGNLHEKLHNDRHSFVVNSSDSGASQTEGASSKDSSFFSEVSQSMFTTPILGISWTLSDQLSPILW